MEAAMTHEFFIDHRDSHHGQSDYTMYLIVGGKRVAYVDYSMYQGEAQIQMIEVYSESDKRKGYGRALVNRLSDQVGGYEKIDWGMMTGSGHALQVAMDKEKGFDRLEHMNKHFKKDEMIALIKGRSIEAAKFFEDLTNIGSATWKKWKGFLRERGFPTEIDGIDLNDLHNLADWTRDSVENNNPIDIEPPYYMEEIVRELKQKPHEQVHNSAQ